MGVDGNIPLHMAVTKNVIKCVQALIEVGADICLPNNDGDSSESVACQLGFTEIDDYLEDVAEPLIKEAEENN